MSNEALQIGGKRREAKGKGEKERYTHLNAEFQRIARREKKRSERQRRKGKMIPSECRVIIERSHKKAI